MKVFNAGMPPDAMWLEPAGTWQQLLTGRRSADGLFIRAEDALRMFNHMVAAAGTNISTEWCGSEGGTPRKLVYDDETAAWPPGEYPYDESEHERHERIACVKADKQIDQQE